MPTIKQVKNDFLSNLILLSLFRTNKWRQRKVLLSTGHWCLLWWCICPYSPRDFPGSFLPAKEQVEKQGFWGWNANRSCIPKIWQIWITRDGVERRMCSVRRDRLLGWACSHSRSRHSKCCCWLQLNQLFNDAVPNQSTCISISR